jgi:3-hydroxyisobutyrate dehydrogenase-like beta-hydroxyacid dehydrogenase
MSDQRIGIIGVGLLGSAIATRLHHLGWSVIAYDTDATRVQALRTISLESAESAAQVTGSTNRCLLCLPNSDIVADVMGEILPECHWPYTVIDCTTGAPDVTAALGTRLHGTGVNYLDATVLGSSAEARSGDVVLMIGGLPESVSANRDLFSAMSRSWFHLGSWGSGARAKLVVNLVLGLNRAVLAEGLTFAAKLELDPRAMLEVMRAGAAYSRVMDTKGEKMLSGDFAPVARLAQHYKDVRLILDAATSCGATVPLSELHATLLERVITAGYGAEDNSAVIRAFQ